MGTVVLSGSEALTVTMVHNRFIDEYMPQANGEFVKIYLYLLRVLSSRDRELSVSTIADKFNHTENDVVRALKYWEQQGLLALSFDAGHNLREIRIHAWDATKEADFEEERRLELARAEAEENRRRELARAEAEEERRRELARAEAEENRRRELARVEAEEERRLGLARVEVEMERRREPVKEETAGTSRSLSRREYTAEEITRFKQQEDFEEIIYVAQKLMNTPLSRSDINTFIWFYDELAMSVELIEYLVEYCVSEGKTNTRYMNKVAEEWKKKGIDSVEKAKGDTQYSRDCYKVLNALGMGRSPVPSDKDFLLRWKNDFGFTMDIIINACERTIKHATKPSMEYTDRILSNWKDKGVVHMSDVKKLDEAYEQAKESAKESAREAGAGKAGRSGGSGSTGNTGGSAQTGRNGEAKTIKKNSFNDFSQRTYNDDEIEKELLKRYSS